MPDIVVASFYKFTSFDDVSPVKARLQRVAEEAGVFGTILVAREGLNGTVAGSRIGIDSVLGAIRALPGCADLEHKETAALTQPFYRLKVRRKNEIVTMGVPGIDPGALVGTYVEPEDWNELIANPDVVVIDARNDYEVRIGTFDGAVNPEIASFREFPDWFKHFSARNPAPKIAMFCTGGIRCEKATSLLKSLNVPEVYHLKGGILRYLERIPESDSRWRGECFVFDQRAALNHDGAPGSHDLCYACRNPVSETDKASAQYIAGVCCPHCHGSHSPERIAAFEERQRQIELAKQRGERHIGAKSTPRDEKPKSSADADRDALRLPFRVDHG